MFDIGFGELLLVMVIGLVVLGPERLPVAVRTVAGWIRTLRSLATTVQNELSQELKLQELQESLKKAEEAGLKNLSPELQASMDELKNAASSVQRGYQQASDAVSKTENVAKAALHNRVDLNGEQPEFNPEKEGVKAHSSVNEAKLSVEEHESPASSSYDSKVVADSANKTP